MEYQGKKASRLIKRYNRGSLYVMLVNLPSNSMFMLIHYDYIHESTPTLFHFPIIVVFLLLRLVLSPSHII